MLQHACLPSPDLGPWPDVTKLPLPGDGKNGIRVWVALVALGLWARVCAT